MGIGVRCRTGDRPPAVAPDEAGREAGLPAEGLPYAFAWVTGSSLNPHSSA